MPGWRARGKTTVLFRLWRTHSCVPCSHSCEHKLETVISQRRHECRRGTHECVRHGSSTECPSSCGLIQVDENDYLSRAEARLRVFQRSVTKSPFSAPCGYLVTLTVAELLGS